ELAEVLEALLEADVPRAPAHVLPAEQADRGDGRGRVGLLIAVTGAFGVGAGVEEVVDAVPGGVRDVQAGHRAGLERLDEPAVDREVAGDTRRVAEAAGGVLPGDAAVDGALGRALEDRVGGQAISFAQADGSHGVLVAVAGQRAVSALAGDEPLEGPLDVLGVQVILAGTLVGLAGAEERQEAERAAGDVVVAALVAAIALAVNVEVV